MSVLRNCQQSVIKQLHATTRWDLIHAFVLKALLETAFHAKVFICVYVSSSA